MSDWHTRWPALRSRLAQCCETYAQGTKRRRLGIRGGPARTDIKDARPRNPGHQQLEKVLRLLLELLHPADLEQAPDARALALLDRHRARFGDVQSLRRLLRRHGCSGQDKQTFPVHPEILAALQARPCLTLDEEALFRRLNGDVEQHSRKRRRDHTTRTYKRAALLRGLRELRAWRQRQLEPKRKTKAPEQGPEVELHTVGALSLAQAAQFCLSTHNERFRRRLLHVTGFAHSDDELVRAIGRLREHAVRFQALRRAANGSANWRLEHYLGLLQALEPRGASGALPDVDLLGQAASAWPFERLQQALRGQGLQQTRLLAQALREAGRVDEAERLQRPRALRKDDLAAHSVFHAQLLGEFEEFESANCDRSAFFEEHLKRLTRGFCVVLDGLEAYARTWANERDPAPDGPLRAFLREADVGELECALRSLVRGVRAQPARLKSRHCTHQGVPLAALALRFLKGSLRRHLVVARPLLRTLTIRDVLRGVPNQHRQAKVRALHVALPAPRRTFREDELDALESVARDPGEALLLTLLREVGLRRSALAHLRLEALLDERLVPRAECAVLEKNNQLRTFVASEKLQRQARLVVELLLQGGQGHADAPYGGLRGAFLLNLSNVRKPCRCIPDTLLRLARAAGVADVRVHPHAFRHTLVGRLVSVGNGLEAVAKYMGHESAHTTAYFYWLPGPRDLLAASFINPFLRTKDHDASQGAQHDSDSRLHALLQRALQACDATSRDHVLRALHSVPELPRLLAPDDVQQLGQLQRPG